MESINTVVKIIIAALTWVFSIAVFGLIAKLIYLLFMLGWDIV